MRSSPSSGQFLATISRRGERRKAAHLELHRDGAKHSCVRDHCVLPKFVGQSSAVPPKVLAWHVDNQAMERNTAPLVSEETIMAWTTPTLVEICVGLEINGYLPAEF
jgi:coenzyme PQQ precursor peptide PqqA